MFSANVSNFMLILSVTAVPTIFSIVAHEVMHGEVAKQLGDDTAQRAGRLTLNPISHVDPFGTIILPGLLLYFGLPVFGWAKPVPVDFRRLRNGRTGMMMVAAAGPLTNVILAVRERTAAAAPSAAARSTRLARGSGSATLHALLCGSN